jgi:DNA invertase Pin-like site-specific DNA recombinase
MANLRWVSWAAVSSLPQAKKISIDEQLKTNRDHVDRHGGKLVAELIVPGESRNIVLFEDAAHKMEAYAKLHELIKAHAFDVLVYLDRSRLGRQASLSMAVVALCNEAGIATYETDNPPATINMEATHDDALIGAIKSVGAQQEIRKFTKRHEMGMMGRAKAGKMASHAPYGYTFTYHFNGEEVIKEVATNVEQAEVVRYIFAEYLRGRGAETIRDQLNAQGTPAAIGGKWSVSSIRQTLRRMWTYAGYAEANRTTKRRRQYIRAKGTWEAIIDDDIAEMAESELKARQANQNISDTGYLLTAICFCAVCDGKPMTVHKYTQRYKDTVYAVVRLDCRKAPHGKNTVSYRRVLKALEAAMVFLNEADPAAMQVEHVTVDNAQVKIDNQIAMLNKLRDGLLKVDDDYYSGAIEHDRYRRQVTRLETQIAQAETELAKLQSAYESDKHKGKRHERITEARELGLAVLHQADITAANAWLRQHVQIYIKDGEVVEVRFI